MARPAYFYKFCTPKAAKLNLATRVLRFSSPLCFNDPFDCYFPPKFANLNQNVSAVERRYHAIFKGEETLPADSRAAFSLAPLIELVRTGVVPTEVIEHGRRTQRANVLAVAKQFNCESQFDWEGMLRKFRVLSLCADGTNANRQTAKVKTIFEGARDMF